MAQFSPLAQRTAYRKARDSPGRIVTSLLQVCRCPLSFIDVVCSQGGGSMSATSSFWQTAELYVYWLYLLPNVKSVL
jgi:hypothetical protein